MSMTDDTPTWREALEFFFRQYLPRHRGFSANTQESYATALRLLVETTKKRSDHPHELKVGDVLGFLEQLESRRKNSAQSRNLRLAALKCFWKAMLLRDPAHRAEYERLLEVPFKRHPQRSPDYLEGDELARLFGLVDATTRRGFRDLVLLRYAYNTGSRISELANARVSWLMLSDRPEVSIRGKGGKVRVCPLWVSTAELLRVYIRQERALPKPGFEQFLFLTRTGRPFTRFGVYKLVLDYFARTAAVMPSLKHKHLTVHSLRHTTAVHLLRAGVEINVIKAWLGHADVSTTSAYLDLDLDKKREALERFLKLDIDRMVGNPQNQAPLPANIVAWLERL